MREEFFIERHGKRYVLFQGLLDEAHDRGLKGIDTELLQVPEESNGNVAVVKARVEMEDGRTFSGIGDASPDNVGRAIAPHLIRMAETRAKARALRDAVNVGATALEELSDGDDAPPVETFTQAENTRHPTPIRNQKPQPAPERSDENGSEAAAGSAASGTNARGSRGRGEARARKSQVDLLKTLATEWRGENGVERLEAKIGRPLTELSRSEADDWIDRLTPEGRE